MARIIAIALLVLCIAASFVFGQVRGPKPAQVERPEATNDEKVPAEPGDDARDKQNRPARAQLERMIPEVPFDGVAFTDVIDFLRDVTTANIFVNWRALEAAGFERSTPVTTNLRSVKFSKALQIILDAAGGGKGKLGYEIDDGVITVSTVEDLGLNVHTRAYDVRELVSSKPDVGEAEWDKRMEMLKKLITGSVAPNSWRDRGGSCAAIREAEGKLVITQNPENHDAIANLLNQTRLLLGLKPIEEPAPVVPEPKE
jgi:hypothetical protein